MSLRIFIPLIFLLTSLNLFAFSEEKFARSLGLEPVLEGNPYTFLGVHTVYTNDTLSRQMLVMNDVPAKLTEARIIKSKDYLIVEIPKDDTRYVSMALVGISEDEVKDRWKITTSVWKTILDELSPIKKSYAQDCNPFGISYGSGIEGLQNFFSSTVGRHALSCLGDILQGAWGSTGGFVISIGEGIANLLKDPKKFWDGKVAQMKQIVDFIKSFDGKIQSSFPTLGNLPVEAKLSFFCGLAGGIGGSLLFSALTGGSTLWKVLGVMATTLRHVVALHPAFQVLKKSNHIKLMPKEFFTKLQRSSNPQRIVDEINRVARLGNPQLILQRMRTI